MLQEKVESSDDPRQEDKEYVSVSVCDNKDIIRLLTLWSNMDNQQLHLWNKPPPSTCFFSDHTSCIIMTAQMTEPDELSVLMTPPSTSTYDLTEGSASSCLL